MGYLIFKTKGKGARNASSRMWTELAQQLSSRPRQPTPAHPQLALSQDFRKFAKKSKAGADQEKNSKMAGVAEKNPGFLAILQ